MMDEPQLVVPFIYLGSEDSLSSEKLHVINASNRVVAYPPDTPVTTIGMKDLTIPAIGVHTTFCSTFRQFWDSLTRGADALRDLVNTQHTVFIHCQKGVNRSVAILLFYLIIYAKYTVRDALHLLSKVNGQRNPPQPVLSNKTFYYVLCLVSYVRHQWLPEQAFKDYVSDQQQWENGNYRTQFKRDMNVIAQLLSKL